MKTVIKVEGMICRSCETLLKEALAEIGVKAEASHEKGTIKVEFDEAKITLEDVKEVIRAEGYEVI